MTPGKMLGDWKRDCTSSTLVDSALPGSQYFASFFSAPVSLVDSGKARTSTTSQKPTTTHLVQLPAGISAILLSLLIDSPRIRWRSVPLIGPWSSDPALLVGGQERSSTSLVQTLTAGNPPGIWQTRVRILIFSRGPSDLQLVRPQAAPTTDKSAPTLSMLPSLCTR